MHFVEDVSHPAGVLFSGSRVKHHITLNVAGGLVVLAMADLPAEVRYQQRGMAEPAHGVVQRLAWRERLMAALVCQDPQSSAKETLHDSVDGP